MDPVTRLGLAEIEQEVLEEGVACLICEKAMPKPRKTGYRHICEACEERITGPIIRGIEKRGRNESCLCGSGRKYKHCCLKKTENERLSIVGENDEQSTN